jgi:hypothetical protein
MPHLDAASLVANRSSGLLVPGAVVLADLNGDGIPDLIVANSGGNDVLVYPGLRKGQFGPALNNHQGFAVGTNPVGITVANLNGRPDLVVANQGFTDVSILLNVPTADGGFTFIPGPRLAGGDGPVATVVQNVNGGAYPDLLISDSGSNQVRMLRGVGGGFFDDQDPTIYNVGTSPGPLFVGNFTGNPSQLDLVTVNAGSNDLSLVTDINGGNTVAQSIPSGGVLPIAAVEGDFGGAGAGNGLLVANNGDGHLALFLSGAGGLTLSQTYEEPGLPNPTALAVAGNGEVFADNEGAEAAIPVILGLGGTSGTAVLATGLAEQQVVSLQPLSPASLGLIATLLSVPAAPEAQSASATGGNAAEGQGRGVTTASSPAVSAFAVAVAPAGSVATSTAQSTEAEAGATATATGGAGTAALPNQPAPKGVTAGQNGAGAPDAAEIPGNPGNPQPVPTAMAQFIAEIKTSFVEARQRARLGALFGPLARLEGGEHSRRVLVAVLTPPIFAKAQLA